MDKVKVTLALLKKYHFWVMLLLAVLISTTGWFLATRQLWDAYDKNRAEIKAKFDEMNRVNSEEQQNEDWIKGIQQETDKLKVKVAQAWRKAYLHQKTKVLRWPQNLVHAEVFEQTDPSKEFILDARDEYWNYIRHEFPRLLAIVAAENLKDKKDRGSKQAATTDGERQEYKVVWDEKSQKKVDDELMWETTPTSAQVREAQENLWVYEALLKIVANLNEFASGNYNAKVKRIDELLIGKDAASEFQKGMAESGHDIFIPAAPAGTEQPGGSPPGAQGGAGGDSSSSARYVDESGKPLPAPPAGAEFKRMPVVMKLLIDQQELANLLVQCANSPLPVEVRQFRVTALPRKKRIPGQGGGQGGGLRGEGVVEPGAYDVEVELQGIISIFNPPDRAKLGDLATIGPGDTEPAAPAKAAADGAAPAVPSGQVPSGQAKPGQAQPAGAEENPAAAAPEPAAPVAADEMPEQPAEAK